MQIDDGVVVQVQRIVAIVGRVDGQRYQDRRRYLFHRNAHALYFRRQHRQRQADFVLCLHGGQIDVGAQLERDVDGQQPVVGAAGEEVHHPVEADQLLLDRLRDGLLQILRVARRGNSP